MDHKWKQVILAVNFLLGLRMNEIPQLRHLYILDPHRPLICSAVYSICKAVNREDKRSRR
jgi:hypothetical protein